jgi:predicted dehydrogenase
VDLEQVELWGLRDLGMLAVKGCSAIMQKSHLRGLIDQGSAGQYLIGPIAASSDTSQPWKPPKWNRTWDSGYGSLVEEQAPSD